MIDAGKFEIQPHVIDVNALCQSSLAIVRQQAAQKSIALAYVEDKAVSKVYADPLRLKQILVNLLTNAVKFAPGDGKVTLEAHADAGGDLIQFAVSDTGVGIAAEDLRQLFQPLSQTRKDLNAHFEGTRLGLALIQRLTDLHGGSMHVESEPGKGSRFIINLPLGQHLWETQSEIQTEHQSPSDRQLPSNESPRHTTLLMAEDNETSALTVREYLESYGYNVVVAHDGLEARAKAEKVRPNLILMDMQMPVMSGLDAITYLRADRRFASTPIIALTALSLPGDRELCFQAGANEYLSKPVRLKVLLHSIETLLKFPNGV
jgi:CheY-like chemotaxis protein